MCGGRVGMRRLLRTDCGCRRAGDLMMVIHWSGRRNLHNALQWHDAPSSLEFAAKGDSGSEVG